MRRGLSCVWLLWVSALSLATERDVVTTPWSEHGVRQFGFAQGLPQQTVFAMAVDAQGFLLVGTRVGLAGYDGQAFVALHEEQLAGCWVRRLLSFGEAVVVGTDDCGLWWRQDGVLTSMPLAPTGLSIEALARDGEALLVGTPEGIQRCLGRNCRPVPATQGIEVAAILVEADGWWVGTNLDGLLHFRRGVDGAVTGPPRRWGRRDGLPNDAVRALLKDREGRLWIGTGKGLAILEGDGLESLRHADGKPLGTCLALAEDAAGTVWAGFYGRGLVGFGSDGSYRLGLAEGLPDAYVLSLLSDQTLWIGTVGGGLARLEPGRWRAFAEGQGLPGRPVVGVGLVDLGQGPRVFAGTPAGTVLLEDGKLRPWLPDPYASRVVRQALRTDAGDLWLATDQGVLLRRGGSWREYTAERDGLPATRAHALAWHDGALWVGTNHGLTRITESGVSPPAWSPANREFGVAALHVHQSGDRRWLLVASRDGLAIADGGGLEPLSGCAVKKIHDLAEVRGEVWLGSESGPWRLLAEGGSWRCQPVREPGGEHGGTGRGRPVLHIVEDHRGGVYLFSFDGVRRLSGAGEDHTFTRVETFGVDDGLPSPEFGGSAVVDASGIVYAGNAAGLVSFDPAAIDADAPPGSLWIQAEVGEKPLRGERVLPYVHPPVTVTPRLLSFQREHRIRYRSRLQGLETGFTPWQRSGDRSFARLPPGSYRLEVEARDAGGQVHGPVALAFRVATPWWTHPVALALYTLLLLTAGLGLGRWRLRQLRARAELLERLVAERTNELERASNTDPLTGAWNRRLFHARILPWLRASSESGGLLLAVVDIDHFKQINDRYGHSVGDAVLRAVARRLMQLPDSEVVRWGGEEFLLVFHHAGTGDPASRIAAALAAVRTTPVDTHAGPVAVACSIGYRVLSAELPTASGVDQAIHQADQALYRAKRAGRNRAEAAR